MYKAILAILLTIIIFASWGYTIYAYNNPPTGVSEEDWKVLDAQFTKSCPGVRAEWATYRQSEVLTDVLLSKITQKCIKDMVKQYSVEPDAEDNQPNKSKFRHSSSGRVAALQTNGMRIFPATYFGDIDERQHRFNF